MRERVGLRRARRPGRAKAIFWIGGFPGGYERFELRGRVLRHGHEPGPEIADDLRRYLLRAATVENLWRVIASSGCWSWTKPPPDTTCDGTQWRLRLRHGVRQLDVYGSNAFPPLGTLEPSPAFARLLYAFRAAARDRLA
jgi:hypothetical protein